MPRPTKDSVFPWDYTYVDDDGFDDGRSPKAATLACRGVPIPAVVQDVPRPTAAEHGSGPWWLCQDPAAGGDSYAQNVLHLAVHYGLVPVLSRSQIAAAPDIEVTALRSISLPVYDDHGQLGHRLVRKVREHVRKLTAEANIGQGDELLRDLVTTLDDLLEAFPGSRVHTVRLGLARFPYRPWREGPTAERVHPVILKDEHQRQADDAGAKARADHDGDLRHPTEVVLAQLDAGDANGVRALLQAPDITADRAYWLAAMLVAREDLARAEARQADACGETDAPQVPVASLIEEAWRRADELGSADGSYELASLLHGHGELVEAEAVAARADERGSPSGALLLGSLMDRRGETTAAEAAFRRGDERGNGSAAFRLGMALKERGQDDEAAAAFGRADERGDARAATIMGLRLRDAGDLDAAAASFRRADERGDGPGAYLLGLMAKDGGDEVWAEAACRRADERGEPHSATAIGIGAAANRDLPAAEAAFRRADQRGDALAALFLGTLLDEDGRHDQAEAAYRRGAERGNGEAAFRLGCRLTARGETADAERAWRRAAELGNPEGKLNLAYGLVNRGEIREALPLLQAAMASGHPECAPRATLTLGSLFARAGAIREAREAFELVIRSQHPEIAPMAAAELAALTDQAPNDVPASSPDESRKPSGPQ